MRGCYEDGSRQERGKPLTLLPLNSRTSRSCSDSEDRVEFSKCLSSESYFWLTKSRYLGVLTAIYPYLFSNTFTYDYHVYYRAGGAALFGDQQASDHIIQTLANWLGVEPIHLNVLPSTKGQFRGDLVIYRNDKGCTIGDKSSVSGMQS
jgi:DNA topoisomerase VI subunit A